MIYKGLQVTKTKRKTLRSIFVRLASIEANRGSLRISFQFPALYSLTPALKASSSLDMSTTSSAP
ncbi:hypothetical protein Hanom_Chr17g01535841 [Helianthus anomalus]